MECLSYSCEVRHIYNKLILQCKSFRYVIDQKELFENKNIIELGAGAGLSGLVATNFGMCYRKYIFEINTK